VDLHLYDPVLCITKMNLAGKFEICQISLLYIVRATDSVILDHAVVYEVQSQILMQWYSWLQKKRELSE
jgi:hypothetical protein